MTRTGSKYFASIRRTAAGTALVLMATWFASELHLNLAAAGFLQLLVVVAVALRAGFWEATFVSALANCCLNYLFIPPFFSFFIADPQNWAALIAFEISALAVSRFSTQARVHAQEATMRQKELEQVYEVSRQLLLSERQESPGLQMLKLIDKVYGIEAGALVDSASSQVEQLGTDGDGLAEQTRGAYLQDREPLSSDGRTWVRVVRFGVRPIGAIGLQGDGLTAATANALCSLTAIALERAHSFERATQAEAERQSEQLRTTVLDALAHEYKTPLTVVRTATSGLIEMGQLSATQSQLIGLIDSETMRLSDLTTRLLQMSRLDGADVRLRPKRVEAGELVAGVLSAATPFLSGHLVQTRGLESSAYIQADRELVTLALIQFLDNAAKYSEPASTVTVGIAVIAGMVRFSVHNDGSVVPLVDREHIFQRFYRSPSTKHKAAGTGVGLSITKKVAEIHKGRVWVESEEGNGSTFFLELPLWGIQQI